MFKLFLGALGGVFVGALLIEIVRRKKPGAVEELEEKAKRVIAHVGIPEECRTEVDLQLAE